MQEWEKAPLAEKNTASWQEAPQVQMPSINEVPTTEGRTVGDDTRPVVERTAGKVVKEEFNKQVGERIGLDPANYDAVHKYIGLLTPIVDTVAILGDMMLGGGRAAAMGGPEALEDIGILPERTGEYVGSARSLGRDIINIGEVVGMHSGVTPAMRAFTGVSNVNNAKKTSQLADNVQALEVAGMEPSLALASESKGVRSLATGLENTPFVGGPLQKNADKALDTVTEAAEGVINKTGTPGDDVGIGDTVRKGVERFANNVEDVVDISKPARETSAASKGKAIYDRAGIDEATTIVPTNTADSIAPVVSKYSDEAFSKVFKNTKLKAISQRLESGEPISYEDLKQFRRDVYKLRNKQNLAADVDSKDIDKLYTGITRDLEEIARSQGKLKEFKRAEKFWSKSQDRINKSLQKFAGDNLSDEQIYARIERFAKEGSMGNVRALRTLRNSLRKDEWSDIAATVFDRLGQKDGAFNANQFITNYSKLSPQAKSILTSQTPHLKGAYENLSKATRLLQRYDRARPRGSAPMQTTLGTGLVGMQVIEVVLSGGLPLVSTLGIGAARATSSLLASPRFVKMLARGQKIKLKASRGEDITKAAEELTRDIYLLSASNDVSAVDLKGLINTLGPERAAAKEEDENQGIED